LSSTWFGNGANASDFEPHPEFGFLCPLLKPGVSL
jgi:hypothetical protein